MDSLRRRKRRRRKREEEEESAERSTVGRRPLHGRRRRRRRRRRRTTRQKRREGHRFPVFSSFYFLWYSCTFSPSSRFLASPPSKCPLNVSGECTYERRKLPRQSQIATFVPSCCSSEKHNLPCFHYVEPLSCASSIFLP